MTFFEDLLEIDLATASKTVARKLSDIVAALDQLVPKLFTTKDRMAVRRYCFYTDFAAQWLANLQAHHPDALPPPAYTYDYLRRNAVALPWTAPTADGLGVVTVLVDRLRGVATGLPKSMCSRPRKSTDTTSPGSSRPCPKRSSKWSTASRCGGPWKP